MFWERVPKSVFVGSEIFQQDIYDAVAHFNFGCQDSVKILEELGSTPRHYCEDEAERADSVRVLKANYKKDGVNKSQ